MVLRILPFRSLARYLGPQLPPTEVLNASGVLPPVARRVAWAVDLMSRHTPWESACLAQAIAGKSMLARRRIPALLYLGTRRDASGHLAAHAWLCVAGRTILGAREQGTFTALTTFGAATPQIDH
jgi:hypothetical protein